MARPAAILPLHRRHPRFARSFSHGLSLVELMVSLVLGLMLVGGALAFYATSQQSWRDQEGLARVQEGARLALDQMAREIRTAGTIPCGSPLTANVLVKRDEPTPWWADTHSGVLRGGENNDQGVLAANTTVPRAAGTDSLIILRTSDDEGLYARVLTHDADRFQFSVAASEPAPLNNDKPALAATVARIGERGYALVCDGHSAALFQVDRVQTASGVVTYGDSPGNCTTSLGSVDAACGAPADGAPAAKNFPPGALLVPWAASFWYVAQPEKGLRALYRAAPDTGGVLRPEERVPAVEDLQIEYLTRDRTNGGALAAGWVDASALTGKWSDPKWEVAALRLTLTLQHQANATATVGAAPVLRVFRSVVALRSGEL